MNVDVLLAVLSVVPLLMLLIPMLIGLRNYRRLGQHYATTRLPKAGAVPLRVVIGPGVYAKPWCVVEVDAEGVLLSPTQHFARTMSALWVPWTDIDATPGRAMFARAAVLRFTKVDGATLHVPGSVADDILTLAEPGHSGG